MQTIHDASFALLFPFPLSPSLFVQGCTHVLHESVRWAFEKSKKPSLKPPGLFAIHAITLTLTQITILFASDHER